MTITSNSIESNDIRGAITELEARGIAGDLAEAIASHIIYTDTDYTQEA